MVGKLEASEQYEPPKEFHWSEVAAVGQRASGSVVVAPTGKQVVSNFGILLQYNTVQYSYYIMYHIYSKYVFWQALLEISRPSSLSYRSSQTLAAPLELPDRSALVSAAFLARDGHEFAVVALADRTVHLLQFADRGLERCAEWRCNSSLCELGGLWCARDSVLLLANRREKEHSERQTRGSSSAGPVLYVLNVQHGYDEKRKLVPRRALTGLPAGTLLHVAAVAPDTRRIALMDASQSTISVFEF